MKKEGKTKRAPLQNFFYKFVKKMLNDFIHSILSCLFYTVYEYLTPSHAPKSDYHLMNETHLRVHRIIYLHSKIKKKSVKWRIRK